MEHGVAADFGGITEDRAELSQPGFRNPVRQPDGYRLLVEPQVGQDNPGAEVRAVAEDRIADVTEMRHLNFIHQKAVLELAGVTQHAAFTDNDVATKISTWPNFRVSSNPERSNQRRVRGQFNGFMNPNLTFNVNARRELSACGKRARRQCRSNCFDPFPRSHIGREMIGEWCK